MATTTAVIADSIALQQTTIHHKTHEPREQSTSTAVDNTLLTHPSFSSNNAPPSLSSPRTPPSTLRQTLTIFQPSLVNFLASFTNGFITVGLPSIARSISLERSLYLWPQSVTGLTSGSMLLVAGSIAGITGPRPIELLAIFLSGIFTLACGFARTGEQLVVFRALQGLAIAMHLPASVALVAAGVPSGKARNIGFACLGLSQPLGFSVGMVASGIMIERAGWRAGFYVAGAATLGAAAAAVWMLPKVEVRVQDGGKGMWKRIVGEVDWVGGFLASGGLAILSYVLASISADTSSIRTATTASLLALSLVLLAAFPAWMHYRKQAGQSMLVPNSLWKNLPFTSICLMVLLSNGGINGMEIFSSLYFQEIQSATPLTASLWLLPNLLVGILVNLTTGMLVHRLPARTLVALSALTCSAGPLTMALLDPRWGYWRAEAWVQAVSPLCVDIMFTVGLIVVSDVFAEGEQALAGAVFSTVSQFGMSLGVGVCQVVALSVAARKGGGEKVGGVAFEDQDALALLAGYRASFWTIFAYMMACMVIATLGLRRVGQVGLKRD